jgi:hypothetical protein
VIEIDIEGAAAPPRANVELVFDAAWQGRAFGICVALLEREGLGWDAFRPHLIAATQADPDAPYYERFAIALEEFASSLG